MANQRQLGRVRPSRLRRFLQVLLGILGLLLLGYLAVLGYRFAQIRLRRFAPLTAVRILAFLLATFGPWLLVRYLGVIRVGLAGGGQRVGAVLAATGLPQRFARRCPWFSRFLVARFT